MTPPLTVGPAMTPPLFSALNKPAKYRVYFNRHGAAPLIWCVSPEDGSWEIAVADIEIEGRVSSRYTRKDTADDDDGRPSGWFEVVGVLHVAPGGIATIGQR